MTGERSHPENSARKPEAANTVQPPHQASKIRPCPPADALDGPKKLYRLSRRNVAPFGDFLTAEERNFRPDADPCLRRALSCNETQEGLHNLKRRVSFFRDQYILQGVVPLGAGKVRHTPSHGDPTHWSWWPLDGEDREQYFAVLT